MALAAIVVARIPETSARKPGAVASLAPKLAVPDRLRGDLISLLPILVASWAIAGLYLSLGPSVAAGVFGLSSHLVGGLVVTLLEAVRQLQRPRVHPAGVLAQIRRQRRHQLVLRGDHRGVEPERCGRARQARQEQCARLALR